MPDILAGLIVFAADEITPDNPMAQLIVPMGILAFLGSTYLLLRSNLGTKRAYYVLGTCLFGFLFVLSLFWGFGAPGTPQATGPTNLPGQAPDALQAKWVPFAQDSLLADREDLEVVKAYPEGFVEGGWPPDMEAEEGGEGNLIDQGVGELANFLAAEAAGQQIQATWAAETVSYAEAPGTAFPIVAVTFRETDEALQPVPDGATYTGFAYYDAGNRLLPSYVFIVLSLIGLLLHGWLLDRDERLEKRRRAALREQAAEGEKVPAGA
jgi:hypothetical protein